MENEKRYWIGIEQGDWFGGKLKTADTKQEAIRLRRSLEERTNVKWIIYGPATANEMEKGNYYGKGF